MGEGSAVAIWVMVAACSASDPVVTCIEAADARASDAVELCRVAYALTRHPLAGANLARSLVKRGATVADVEPFAHAIGDKPGGAGAWAAVGDAYTMLPPEQRQRDDSANAVVKYRRAYDHRLWFESRGRALDAVGLYHHYTLMDEFRDALHYAGIAYDLAIHSGDLQLQAYVLSGEASVLFDIGDLPAVESLASEADKVIDQDSPYWPHMRKVHGVIDRGRGRPGRAAQYLKTAIDSARAAGLDDLVHEVTFEYATLRLEPQPPEDAKARVKRLDEGEAALHDDTTIEKADPYDRVRHVLALAQFDVARGLYGEAVKLIDGALTFAPAALIPDLRLTRGRALAQQAAPDEAEKDLLASAAGYEARRAKLGFDALKPWVATSARAPLEDLFQLYVESHRDVDAFAIAQRATARSMLDGLVAGPAPKATSLVADLERAGERAAGLIALTVALRSSPAVQPPPVETLIAQLRDKHVLTYFRAHDHLWLIDVPVAGRPRAFDVGTVVELRDHAKPWQSRNIPVTSADEMGSQLLPREVELVPGETLYVSVDEPIREVSFPALRRDGAFLIERNPIVYEPSAAVLAALPGRPVYTGPAIVLGNPGGDLPGAENEAKEVAEILAVEPKLRDKAIRAEVIAAQGTALLHLATHTTSTRLGPAIKLADGDLGAGEVIDKQIKATLVVLASCASANPLDRAELGPLAAAFLAAGARTVVASRWSIDDKLAHRFAHDFYRADGRRNPALAAAIAQRALIDAKIPIAAWSSFVVFGLPTGGESR